MSLGFRQGRGPPRVGARGAMKAIWRPGPAGVAAVREEEVPLAGGAAAEHLDPLRGHAGARRGPRAFAAHRSSRGAGARRATTAGAELRARSGPRAPARPRSSTGPMDGPTAARRRAAGAPASRASARDRRRRGRAARVPRQPAWTAATAPLSGSASEDRDAVGDRDAGRDPAATREDGVRLVGRRAGRAAPAPRARRGPAARGRSARPVARSSRAPVLGDARRVVAHEAAEVQRVERRVGDAARRRVVKPWGNAGEAGGFG